MMSSSLVSAPLGVVLPSWFDWVGVCGAALVGGAALLLLMYLIQLVLQVVFPKVGAIVLATAKESLAQPLFLVALSVAAVLLVLIVFVPYHTFGEDIKMMKTTALTLITIASLIVALWMASVSIADEIEGRTALTLLSKPVKRTEFIIGKFLGVLAPVAILFVLLGTVFLCALAYKVPYDARENSQSPPKFAQVSAEVKQILPGLGLAFMEVIVLTSISVAISTRLPMVPNLILCFTVYALGHLVPVLVQSASQGFELVRFIAQLIAVVIPNLDHFNVEPAVYSNTIVEVGYIGTAMAYCAVYTLFALAGARLLFEDRDLA